MSIYTTEQEEFWAGAFGTDYINRNQGDALLASNLNFFSNCLKGVRNIRSCLEFGANVGMNLRALQLLYPDLDIHALEINANAVKELVNVIYPSCVYHASMLDFKPWRTWDLTLTKGVLIHMNPEVQPRVYDTLVESTGRYLLIAEYYNPAPVSIPYRGHNERLFKRDFAGDIMTRHPRMQLLDYGFVYHSDPNFPQDDLTWFLMKKTEL